MKKKYLNAFIIIIFLALLLIFPKASFAGAKSGLLLWFNTILPTLLPFIIVSNLIIQLNITTYISALFYPILHRLFGISKNGCYPVLIGMLSGYPVGAKACADLVTDRKITKKEGQFLLSFCNNASPMFIISFVSVQCLERPKSCYLILTIILISAILSALIYRLSQHYHPSQNTLPIETISIQTIEKELSFFPLLDNSILNGFRILVKVGGYIILFSILSQIVCLLHFIPEIFRYFIIGSLEITTGISFISTSSFSIASKIILTITITAFGGFSSIAQTKSVISDSGLSIHHYLITKIINASIAACLSILLIHIL